MRDQESAGSTTSVLDHWKQSAKAVGLRYVNDNGSGIRRLKRGKGWSYVDSEGATIRDQVILARIKSLAIPPAWKNVWICPLHHGHLQATGRDAKQRKQYRYHPDWRQVRDETKFNRMLHFGRVLPIIRTHVDADMSRPGLPKEKILATIVRLLETTLIRIGNETYAQTNQSYGLTTLRSKHLEIHGSTIRFRFKGKSGVKHAIGVKDRRLATIIKRCKDLPGQELFQYEDDSGEPRSIDSSDVNDYLRELSGEEITAKDFRTWAASLLALELTRQLEPPTHITHAKKQLNEVIAQVAARLGNTVAICRKCYICPSVMETFLELALHERCAQPVPKAILKDYAQLSPEELLLCTFLA